MPLSSFPPFPPSSSFLSLHARAVACPTRPFLHPANEHTPLPLALVLAQGRLASFHTPANAAVLPAIGVPSQARIVPYGTPSPLKTSRLKSLPGEPCLIFSFPANAEPRKLFASYTQVYGIHPCQILSISASPSCSPQDDDIGYIGVGSRLISFTSYASNYGVFGIRHLVFRTMFLNQLCRLQQQRELSHMSSGGCRYYALLTSPGLLFRATRSYGELW
ncbi:hypothetical protein C8R44DRAFT_754619 [Mycena epipterygia]|nr:hypothetical protein C8R44DRAFT_754619 [Mycena epipterygia]